MICPNCVREGINWEMTQIKAGVVNAGYETTQCALSLVSECGRCGAVIEYHFPYIEHRVDRGDE